MAASECKGLKKKSNTQKPRNSHLKIRMITQNGHLSRNQFIFKTRKARESAIEDPTHAPVHVATRIHVQMKVSRITSAIPNSRARTAHLTLENPVFFVRIPRNSFDASWQF